MGRSLLSWRRGIGFGVAGAAGCIVLRYPSRATLRGVRTAIATTNAAVASVVAGVVAGVVVGRADGPGWAALSAAAAVAFALAVTALFAVGAEAAVGLVDCGLDPGAGEQFLALADLEDLHVLPAAQPVAHLGVLLIDAAELHLDGLGRLTVLAAAHEDVVLRPGGVDRRQRDGQRVLDVVDQDLALGAHARLEARRRLVEREIDRVLLGIVPPALAVVGQHADGAERRVHRRAVGQADLGPHAFAQSPDLRLANADDGLDAARVRQAHQGLALAHLAAFLQGVLCVTVAAGRVNHQPIGRRGDRAGGELFL